MKWTGACAAMLAFAALAPPSVRAGAAPADSLAPGHPHQVLAWPLVVKYDGDDGRSLRMIGPVTGRFVSPRTRASYLAFPVTGAFSTADGRREQWLAWPLVGHRSSARRGLEQFALAGPFVGWTREENAWRSRVSVAPLWYDERRLGGWRAWQLSPLAYHRRDPARASALTEFGVLPGLGGGGLALARTWQSGSARGWNAALLWGHRSDDRGGWTSVFPYVSNSWRDSLRGTSSFHGVLPVYGHWQRPDHTLTLAAPGWWSWRSERLRSVGAWPFWTRFRRVHEDSTVRAGGSIAWPLLSWGEGDDYSAVGLLPFWYRLRDGETRFTSVAPLWFSYSRPGREARMVTPLHVRWRGERDSLEWHGPWYTYRAGARRESGVWPVWGESSGPGFAQRYVLPAWYSRTDSLGDRRMLLPFWGRASEARTGNVTRFWGPYVALDGPAARGRGVVPLWYSGRDTAGQTRSVGPWLQRDYRDGGRRRALLPLAWYESHRGYSALHVLPLSGFTRRPDGRRFTYVLWPLWTRTVQAGGSDRRSSVLLWLGRDEHRGERRRNWLQPLWYYERDGGRARDLDLLGGLLASYRESATQRQWRVLLVPVWTRRTAAAR